MTALITSSLVRLLQSNNLELLAHLFSASYEKEPVIMCVPNLEDAYEEEVGCIGMRIKNEN